eukprot:m51a1_g12311 hypothetical protein (897) ;mRNA; f:399908-403002
MHSICTKALLLSAGLVLLCAAAPAYQQTKDITLADGTTITVENTGDEYTGPRYVDPEGHSIVVTAEGAAPSVVVDDMGTLSGPIASRSDLDRATRGAPTEAPKEWARRAVERQMEALSRRPTSRKHSNRPKPSKEPLLAILVQYKNYTMQPGAVKSTRETLFGDNISVSQYYHKASGGMFNFRPARESFKSKDSKRNDGIVGPLTMNCDLVSATTWGVYPDLTCIERSAFTLASEFVDFDSYDTDCNGILEAHELHVIIVVAGAEGAFIGMGSKCPSVWGHMEPNFKMKLGATNLTVGEHVMIGETWDNCVAPFRMGVVTHELGHSIGLPDLYDVFKGGYKIAGPWCLMDGGNWADGGRNPALLSAFCRSYLGWIKPIVATGMTEPIQLEAASLHPDQVLQFGDNANGIDWAWLNHSGTGEYFLVENRQKVGLDIGAPATGVIVWHVNEGAGTGSNEVPNARQIVKILKYSNDLISYWADQDLLARNEKKVSVGCKGSDRPNSLYDNGLQSCVSFTASVNTTTGIATIEPSTPACSSSCVADATWPAPQIQYYSVNEEFGMSLQNMTGSTPITGQYTFINPSLPFVFPFYGKNYNNIYLTNAGYMTFTHFNYLAIRALDPDHGLYPTIAPLAAAFYPISGSYKATTCSAPLPEGPCFVVEWVRDWPTKFTYQTILTSIGQIYMVFSGVNSWRAPNMFTYVAPGRGGRGTALLGNDASFYSWSLSVDRPSALRFAPRAAALAQLPVVDSLDSYPLVSGDWWQVIGATMSNKCGSATGGNALMFSGDGYTHGASLYPIDVKYCSRVSISYYYGGATASTPECVQSSGEYFGMGWDAVMKSGFEVSNWQPIGTAGQRSTFTADVPEGSKNLFLVWYSGVSGTGMWAIDDLKVTCTVPRF